MQLGRKDREKMTSENLRIMDANVIIYALIEQNRPNLNSKTVNLKKNSRKIVKRVTEGEKVHITTTQISEAANILEKLTEQDISIRIQRFLLEHPSFRIIETTVQDMKDAHRVVETYKDNKIGLNDAIAYVTMQKLNCKEIYTFDKHFDIFQDVVRIEN
jgi:predicted nucleic acid-binding protein